MKPPAKHSGLTDRLPSVSDLLEKPQIKSLVDRVNGLEVTTGVRQFVERMRREVSRRSLDMPIPSIGELADRAARFILGRHADERLQAINATGRLWPAELTGPPLADEAVVALSVAAQHCHSRTAKDRLQSAAAIAGADAAAVFTSPTACLLLSLAALADGKPVVVARGELGTLDDGARLTDLAEQAGVPLVEVGATNHVELADYRRALEAGAGMVLRMESMPYAMSNQNSRPAVGEVAALASKHSAVLVHNIGRGPLAALPASIDLCVITAKESFDAGAAVVVARGDGYLGGPACGVVVGREKLLEKMTTHPLAAALAASPLVSAALEATLALYRNSDRALLAIPTLALLSTPLENLRTRAERLAAQIEAQQGIESAAAVDIASGVDLGGTQPLASHGISVVFEEGEMENFRSRLAASRPRLVGVWEAHRLLLDLRTVTPEEDIALVAAFEAPPAEAPPAEAPPAEVMED